MADLNPPYRVFYTDEAVALERLDANGGTLAVVMMDADGAINCAHAFSQIAVKLIEGADKLLAHQEVINDVESSFPDDE